MEPEKIQIREKYISIGCNRRPFCLDWGSNGLVAFAACHSIAIYKPQLDDGCTGRILYLLNGHKQNVNCIKWVINKDQGFEDCLISGCIDGTVIIWRYFKNDWYQSEVLSSKNGVVMSIAALTTTICGSTIIALAFDNKNIEIWGKNSSEDKFVNIDSINLNNGFALCMSVSTLPTTEALVLACGTDDCKVNLYISVNLKFCHVMQLTGHEDWVQAVSFVHLDCGDLLLASTSQDCSIRIWRISQNETSNSELYKNEDLVLTSNTFDVTWQECTLSFSVVLETILFGHESWVYGLCWHPKIKKEDRSHQPLCLLSSSMDKTIVVWRFDHETGIWIDECRVGDVGGNILGFYGACFSPRGDGILAYSYQGALHMWKKMNDEIKKESCTWQTVFTPGGHFGPVQDISWEPQNGDFLVSLSSDQTTRIHAPWRRENSESTWHEIARPQIHGYNMQCLAIISRYRFVSAADEKVIRVFEAPKSFVEQFTSLCEIKDNNGDHSQSLGASVPVLGLSNKAVFNDDLENLKSDLKDPQRPMKASAFACEEPTPFVPFQCDEPPVESNLLQNTLWPEVQKLYGHGYEIFSLAFNDKSNILASSSKATKAEHAHIILWTTENWRMIGNLQGHSLTITQMEFSSSGTYLLSVSRDRTWCLFQQYKNDEKTPSYKLIAKLDKKVHSRVIWSCSWTSNERYFFTASRDKKVVCWGRLSSEQWLPIGDILNVGKPVTAVAVLPYEFSNQRYLISVGTESGDIFLYIWNITNGWSKLRTPEKIMRHNLAIKRLKWKTKSEEDNMDMLYLASCAEDNCIKIYEIKCRIK